MPTVTIKDPKVQLELPNDLSSDGGEEVLNFPPFKVRPTLPPQLTFYKAHTRPRHRD